MIYTKKHYEELANAVPPGTEVRILSREMMRLHINSTDTHVVISTWHQYSPEEFRRMLEKAINSHIAAMAAGRKG